VAGDPGLGSFISSAADTLNATGISSNVAAVSIPVQTPLTPSVDPLEVTKAQIQAATASLSELEGQVCKSIHTVVCIHDT
jgi:hypothetical protein